MRTQRWLFGFTSLLAGALLCAAAALAGGAGAPVPPPSQEPPGTAAPAEVVRQLQAEVTAAARQFERRDTEGVLRHISEQYRTGPFTKPALRSQMQTMFALYDAMKVRVRIDTVRMVGDHAWVYSSGELTGHFAWLDRWVSVVSWQRELEVARRENGVWRLFGYQQ